MSLFGLVYVLLVALLLVSSWGVGNRDPRAWLWSIGARLLIVVWSTLMHIAALVPIALCFVLVEWRNYTKWRKERAASDRVAAFILGDAEDGP